LPVPVGAGDDDVVVLLHPAAGGELADHGLVEFPARRVVDVLDAGVAELQLRLLERPRESLVLPAQPLRVDEHPEPLLEGQLLQLGVLLLLDPGGRQRIEPQQPELFHRRFRQHMFSLQLS